MASSQSRPYTPLTARYGSIGQNGEWHEAIEAYYWDKLPEAFAVAESLGAGFGGAALRWYRMIEGEALTREAAEIKKINSWLSIEFAESEFALHQNHIEAIEGACRTVAKRLGWDFSMPVLTTVLLEEVDAPWHGARYGYCIDKHPYDKICIPHQAAIHPDSLSRVIAHEFTHVITHNLTASRIPHWLDEGMAQLMEGAPLTTPTVWMDPIEINAAFDVDRRDSQGLAHAGEAYVQSLQLVHHLHQLGGDAKLAQLLGAFTNNSLWSEIKINLLGEPSVEEALHKVYGIGQKQLFSDSKI